MARRSRDRILYDGCYAHVYSRAIERRFIFEENYDFEHFKSLMRETKAKYGYRIHHYCLMHTHFHMVVSIPDLAKFSKGIKVLKHRYARWVHAKRKRGGPIWWGRFGSQLIENEYYLYACGRYIEMNPVKAEIVLRPEEWDYSSSRQYFLGEKDDLVDPYDRPEQMDELLMEDLNVGQGPVIGSSLLKFYVREGIA